MGGLFSDLLLHFLRNQIGVTKCILSSHLLMTTRAIASHSGRSSLSDKAKKFAILALDAISAWLTANGRFPKAVCLIAFFGFVDATLGSKISTRLGGDPYGTFKNLTLDGWWTIVFLMMVFGLVISLMAFLVSMLLNKRKTT